jgi:hypothetical protein
MGSKVVLAADLRDLHASLALLEDRHDLAFLELALPHRPLHSRLGRIL